MLSVLTQESSIALGDWTWNVQGVGHGMSRELGRNVQGLGKNVQGIGQKMSTKVGHAMARGWAKNVQGVGQKISTRIGHEMFSKGEHSFPFLNLDHCKARVLQLLHSSGGQVNNMRGWWKWGLPTISGQEFWGKPGLQDQRRNWVSRETTTCP